MVFGKRREVVMTTPLYADECNFMWIDLLQFFTVFDRYKPIARTMNNVCVTIHMSQPFICPQFIHQQVLHRQKRQKSFHQLGKIIEWRVENEVTGTIV